MEKTKENAVRILRQLVARYEMIHGEDGPARQSRKCLLQQWRNMPEELQAAANAKLIVDGVDIPDGMPFSVIQEWQLSGDEEASA